MSEDFGDLVGKLYIDERHTGDLVMIVLGTCSNNPNDVIVSPANEKGQERRAFPHFGSAVRKQVERLQNSRDNFLGLFDRVKPGDRITFCTGPGNFPTLPSSEGIAYGKGENRWGKWVQVKVTDSSGNVTFETVHGFRTVGIGAYYLGRTDKSYRLGAKK